MSDQHGLLGVIDGKNLYYWHSWIFRSHIADRMLEMNHEVVGVDNLIGGYVDNIPKAAKFHQLDMIDLDGLAEAMQGCDLVYHTACTAYEGLSVFSPSLVVQNTVQISVNAMTATIKSGIKDLSIVPQWPAMAPKKKLHFVKRWFVSHKIHTELQSIVPNSF